MYETDYPCEEMAEALTGRSEAAIRKKLSKLRSKGEKREDLYIGGGGRVQRERARGSANLGHADFTCMHGLAWSVQERITLIDDCAPIAEYLSL